MPQTQGAPATAAAAAGAIGGGGVHRDAAALLQQLSALADDEDSWEADPAYLEYLEAKYRDVECPLFLETLPADPSSDPQLEALQMLAYDGETPQSVAARHKQQGREFLEKAAEERKKRNHKAYALLVQEAEAAYHRALAQGIKDKAELSVLHSNLALCCLKSGKLLRCIDSSREAIKLNSQNLKAYMRGAKASLHLELYAQAERFASMGLQAAAATAAAAATTAATAAGAAATAAGAAEELAAAAGAAAAGVDEAAEKELRVLQREAAAKHEAQQQRRNAAELAQKAAAKSHAPSPSEIFRRRGLEEAAAQVPEVSVHLEALNGECFLLLPLLLLLDEYGRADAISQADERLSLLQQVKPIFPSKAIRLEQQKQQQQQGRRQNEALDFASWDHEKKYFLEDLVAYYECGLPGGVLMSFPLSLPLALLLDRTRRFAGIAAFHILVKGSAAHEAFVRESRIEKLEL
ncbi:hypothetical protein Esti_001892 [Eimeria stiedai]